MISMEVTSCFGHSNSATPSMSTPRIYHFSLGVPMWSWLETEAHMPVAPRTKRPFHSQKTCLGTVSHQILPQSHKLSFHPTLTQSPYVLICFPKEQRLSSCYKSLSLISNILACILMHTMLRIPGNEYSNNEVCHQNKFSSLILNIWRQNSLGH
jgi:hypothetical protein